jgi:hypothetical protein
MGLAICHNSKRAAIASTRCYCKRNPAILFLYGSIESKMTDKQDQFDEWIAKKKMHPAGRPMSIWMVTLAIVIMIVLTIFL